MGNRNNKENSIFLEKRKRYYYELLLPAAIVLAGGYILWKRVLLPLYVSSVPNYVLIFILFTVIAMLYILLCGSMEFFLTRVYPYDSPLSWKRIGIFALAGGVIVGVLSGILEFLYELEPQKDTILPADEIVFVIDDSSSMAWNDRDYVRLSSAKEITDNLDSGKRVGLVRFQSAVTTVVPIDRLTSEHKLLLSNNLYEETNGGTDIGKALEQAIDLYVEDTSDNDRTEDVNRSILLLTDGVSDSFDEASVIAQCREYGIQINAISLGSKTDISFLRRITSETGGRLCKIPSAYYINVAYSILTGKNVRRCLLVPIIALDQSRPYIKILQWLFLSIIGLTLESIMVIMLQYRPYINIHLICSPCMVILSALIVMITNASLAAVFFLLNAYLMPFYTGRVIIRHKVRAPKRIKKPGKSEYKLQRVGILANYSGDTIGRVENHYEADRI